MQFFKCSVFINNIRLDCLTNSTNANSIPTLISHTYVITCDTKTIKSYIGSIYLNLNEDYMYLDSTGDGTKFLANDGDYKTINITKEIPVVTLQLNEDTTTYSKSTETPMYTISQEDAQKLSNYPEHVYFKIDDSNQLLATLLMKPNEIPNIVNISTMTYFTVGGQINIFFTPDDVSVILVETLQLQIGDKSHFYDSIGNKLRLINCISLNSNNFVNLAQFDLNSPVKPFLVRNMSTGEIYTYMADSMELQDQNYIVIFKKIDYTTDQLNVVTIKISTNVGNTIAGELISDKTYTLTPKTE